MKRLVPLLDSSEGDANFTAAFDYDFEHRARIRIRVHSELRLLCQRSLESYTEVVDRESELSVIEDLSEQDLLPDTCEPILVENRTLAMMGLVEDELIIGLPQVPRNPAADTVIVSTCDNPGDSVSVPSDPGMQEKASDAAGPMKKPFADLGRMMAEIDVNNAPAAERKKNS
jgi:uncharacterized protein